MLFIFTSKVAKLIYGKKIKNCFVSKPTKPTETEELKEEEEVKEEEVSSVCSNLTEENIDNSIKVSNAIYSLFMIFPRVNTKEKDGKDIRNTSTR